MLINLFKTYNEGQYGLKPWAANLIMGILEFFLLVGWFFGTLWGYMNAIFGLDFIEAFGFLENSGFVLAGLMLVWNFLVWIIKPLRTKFNYKESLWNVVFIILTIIDSMHMFS